MGVKEEWSGSERRVEWELKKSEVDAREERSWSDSIHHLTDDECSCCLCNQYNAITQQLPPKLPRQQGSTSQTSSVRRSTYSNFIILFAARIPCDETLSHVIEMRL